MVTLLISPWVQTWLGDEFQEKTMGLVLNIQISMPKVQGCKDLYHF
ncbi:hypothetical protein [Rubritalea tangerina]